MKEMEPMESTPTALCPVCLGKLLWNTKCEPIQRFSRLQALMKEWGLKERVRSLKHGLKGRRTWFIDEKK